MFRWVRRKGRGLGWVLGAWRWDGFGGLAGREVILVEAWG